MKRDLQRLASEPYDVLVIGGGIMGAGVARDAALRGLKVALVEKGDFASGTSSRSSKLIHGGLRYLEQGRFRLVREATHERAILHQIAPHLVKPRSILLPIYRNSPRPLWQIRLGLWFYDSLSGSRITPHRILSLSETLAEEPNLNPNSLVGSALFYDCQEDDARFCIETILSATDAGASAANYLEVLGFEKQKGILAAATVRDPVTGNLFSISAQCFVNATGHWLDQVAKLSGLSPLPTLRRTKGVHLLLPKLTTHHGLLLTTSRDKRVFFVLPWQKDFSLVGTTDTDYSGDLDQVYSAPEDVSYLLEAANHYFPSKHLTVDQIQVAFAGLRTFGNSRVEAPSQISREHQILTHSPKFFSILGGKFTTHRLIAEQMTDLLFESLGKKSPPCSTAGQPLPIRPVNIQQAVQEEMAITVMDVMWRRLNLFLTDNHSEEAANNIAKQMQPLLGWSDLQTEKSVQDYLRELECHLPPANH